MLGSPIELDPDEDTTLGVLAAGAAWNANTDGTVTPLVRDGETIAVIAPPPPAGLPGHQHQWTILGTQEVPPVLALFGEAMPRTAVLLRCDGGCGQPSAAVIDGTWTTGQLTGKDPT